MSFNKKGRDDLMQITNDEDGREINPHMPQYIINAPWYLKESTPSLKHQRIRKQQNTSTFDNWYQRGSKGPNNLKFKKGACTNCGSTTHQSKDCCERPRQIGAKFSNTDIQPDDLVSNVQGLNYDAKRDRWNGYDPETYKSQIQEYEILEEKRKETRLQEGQQTESGNLDDEFKDNGTGEHQTQMTTRDPRTKTMTRNLRIREDKANYLLNLDVNSAYFDPKSRSLRENPNPHLPPEKQVFKGLNQIRLTGETLQMYEQERFAWQYAEQHNLNLNTVSLPTLTEKTYKQIKAKKEEQKIGRAESLFDRYGGEEHLNPQMDLLLGQTERFVEYEEDGLPKNPLKKKDLTKSKYLEDFFYGDHTSVWGSWWSDVLGWGYDCCYSNEKHSVCLGEKGRRLQLNKEARLKREIEEEIQKAQTQDQKSSPQHQHQQPQQQIIQQVQQQ
ncbi:unnamed protein product (macronuclear) [Paramecium tetraurelia]|uniref:Pre-mRNA-splicing factor SLU7 n=1 Tax=Paramecium tetraurelia TaxID=5888 RepID=A0E5X4_PARTE|nr:uncharacterized protein GSPATT00003554001 [Paramecium tetraurelia]CAK90691.1 unnamed protein product [Paramecium tetraurelia]|eukprot:XP_001458088.1 hypothetical protein (macronuclear) [Paramecium tetraurelia strain d4-2]